MGAISDGSYKQFGKGYGQIDLASYSNQVNPMGTQSPWGIFALNLVNSIFGGGNSMPNFIGMSGFCNMGGMPNMGIRYPNPSCMNSIFDY